MQKSEILLYNLNAYRHSLKTINDKIKKCKDKLIFYKTENNIKLKSLARYVIKTIRIEDFDAKKCNDMIEEIEDIDNHIEAIENELSIYENQRCDYAEHIKRLEEYMCLR